MITTVQYSVRLRHRDPKSEKLPQRQKLHLQKETSLGGGESCLGFPGGSQTMPISNLANRKVTGPLGRLSPLSGYRRLRLLIPARGFCFSLTFVMSDSGMAAEPLTSLICQPWQIVYAHCSIQRVLFLLSFIAVLACLLACLVVMGHMITRQSY
jgi:hypothetical protein